MVDVAKYSAWQRLQSFLIPKQTQTNYVLPDHAVREVMLHRTRDPTPLHISADYSI